MAAAPCPPRPSTVRLVAYVAGAPTHLLPPARCLGAAAAAALCPSSHRLGWAAGTPVRPLLAAATGAAQPWPRHPGWASAAPVRRQPAAVAPLLPADPRTAAPGGLHGAGRWPRAAALAADADESHAGARSSVPPPPPAPPPPPVGLPGWLRALRRLAVAAVAVAAVVLVAMETSPAAMAAGGGGRIGGSTFHSAPRSSAPSRSSGSGSRQSSGGLRRRSLPPSHEGWQGGGRGGDYYQRRSGGYFGGRRHMDLDGGVGGGYGAGDVLVLPRVYSAPVVRDSSGTMLMTTNVVLFLLLVVLLLAPFLSLDGGASVIGGRVRAAEGAVGVVDADPLTTVATVKVGLLASARDLQHDLDDLTRRANTSSARGLAEVVCEVVIALGRHPDYWTHAAVAAVETPLSSAEAAFGNRSVAERVKLEVETLSNVDGRGVRTAQRRRRTGNEGAAADRSLPPPEYIVVTIVVAATGGLRATLPRRIRSVSDLWRALDAIAAVSTNDMRALEVLWAPQEEGDTLTEAVMLADHPELMRVG